jgi:hypothetical protein
MHVTTQAEHKAACRALIELGTLIANTNARVLTKAEHTAICRGLSDRGKLLEAGFKSLRFLVEPADASELQVSEMRMAFFAGALHVFASIQSMLELGAEATDNDATRMRAIEAELETFVEQFEARLRKSAG